MFDIAYDLSSTVVSYTVYSTYNFAAHTASVPVDIVQKAYLKGIAGILRTLADEPDRVLKVFSKTIYPLMNAENKKRFAEAKDASNIAIEFCYGTAIFRDLKNFMNEKGEWCLPKKNPISLVLLTIGNAVQCPYYLMYDLKLFKIEQFSQIGKALGQYRVFRENPLLAASLYRFKDFWIFLGCSAGTIEILRDHYRANTLFNIKKSLSTEDILKHIGNIGKLILIYCGRDYGTSPWFFHLSTAVNIAGILSPSIKIN